MSILKDSTSKAALEYFDKVIYPEQFQGKGRTARLQNHIIQIVKGHSLPSATALCLLRRYVRPDYTKEQLLEVSSDYNQSWKSICNYDYFTKAIDVLDDEAFEFYTRAGNNTYRRTIKPIEYRFVLNKLSTIIYKNLNSGSKSGVVYNYFLKKSSGITDNYKKVCNRAVDKKKLTHMFKHLEHHKLILRVGNAKNSYDYHIGPANPMYALSIVPDLDESQLREINFKTDREKDFESAVISLRADVKDKDAQIAELKAQLAAGPAQEQPTTEPEPVVKQDPAEITRLAEKHEAEQLGTQCYKELDLVETSTGTCFDNLGLRFGGGQVQDVSNRKSRRSVPSDYFPVE